MGLIIEKASKIDLEDKRDNFYFEKRLDTTDEWIRKRTGIKERFISHTPLSEMATDVAFKLNLSQGEKERIKVLIVSTIGGDYIVPSLASYVHGKLSLPQEVLAFDINMACSGFVGASILCETYLKENELALVIGAEKLSDFTDMADRSTAIIFADGAGAVLYKKDSSKFYKDLGTIFDSKNLTLKRNSYLKMNGREVFKFAINEVPKSIKKLLQESGLKDEDIDIFLLHQANERIKNSVEKHFKGYFYSNIETMGNTSSASVAMSLGDLYEKNRLKDKKILLCGFGGGLNYQTCIVRG